MDFTKKQIKEMVEYWQESAEHDWKTAQSLWQSKRYDACLFYCHLVLEKLLKGLVVIETNTTAPYIHNLVALARKAKFNVDKEQNRILATYTDFNMRCRYSTEKIAFYKLCTRQFSEPYFKETKILITWLKKFYQKNK